MADKIRIYQNRETVISVALGEDVSADTLAAQIRDAPDLDGNLAADWIIEPATDYTDGEITLTLDHITASSLDFVDYYTDIKKVTSGEPVSVFRRPLEVELIGVVTSSPTFGDGSFGIFPFGGPA